MQETSCDVSSFQLYVGSETQRCSQRVTGLFTVHLLGLEEMKSGRLEDTENKLADRNKQEVARLPSQASSHLSLRSEDSKEVFLAIQVDGMTRARTALLTLRGSALPLNHTFHLELERARLLRLLVLTPGEPLLLTQSFFKRDETTRFSCQQRPKRRWIRSKRRQVRPGTGFAAWAGSPSLRCSKVPLAAALSQLPATWPER